MPILRAVKESTAIFPDTVIIEESERSEKEELTKDNTPMIDDDEEIILH